MRVRVGVYTEARELPWESVVRPGRAVVYSLLERAAPELSAELHERGRPPYGMTPFGYGAPVFPRARRKRGVYAAGGHGVWEIVSPLPEVVEAVCQALSSVPVLAWGAVAFIVEKIDVLEPPPFAEGLADLRTSTPVVLKGPAGDRQTWLLPGEPGWEEAFENNLRRKAATLGLAQDVSVEQVTWSGPRRSFAVAGSRGSGGGKPGAPVEVRLKGTPETIGALWSWGLGQANSTGFGTVIA
jgi:CRISPR-associated endoribonuclease Cas6